MKNFNLLINENKCGFMLLKEGFFMSHRCGKKVNETLNSTDF